MIDIHTCATPHMCDCRTACGNMSNTAKTRVDTCSDCVTGKMSPYPTEVITAKEKYSDRAYWYAAIGKCVRVERRGGGWEGRLA